MDSASGNSTYSKVFSDAASPAKDNSKSDELWDSIFRDTKSTEKTKTAENDASKDKDNTASQSLSPDEQASPWTSKAGTEGGGEDEVQSQSTADTPIDSTTSEISLKEPCEKETSTDKDKIASKTTVPDPKKGTKRKAEKFKAKIVKLQHVFIEECTSDDETLQMVPKIRRRMNECLKATSQGLKLIVSSCNITNSKVMTENIDAPLPVKVNPPIKKITFHDSDSTHKQCPKCNEFFQDAKYYKAHNCKADPRVVGTGSYSCTDCPERFDTKVNLMDHMHTSHQPKPRRRFTCCFCHQVFSQRSAQNQHEKTEHGSQAYFKCEHCLHTFPTRAVLNRHEKHMGHGSWYAVPPQSATGKVETAESGFS